jgi:hypothetical protein
MVGVIAFAEFLFLYDWDMFPSFVFWLGVCICFSAGS